MISALSFTTNKYAINVCAFTQLSADNCRIPPLDEYGMPLPMLAAAELALLLQEAEIPKELQPSQCVGRLHAAFVLNTNGIPNSSDSMTSLLFKLRHVAHGDTRSNVQTPMNCNRRLFCTQNLREVQWELCKRNTLRKNMYIANCKRLT